MGAISSTPTISCEQLLLDRSLADPGAPVSSLVAPSVARLGPDLPRRRNPPDPDARPIPRGIGLDKVSVRRHVRALDETPEDLRTYCRHHSISVDLLARAIERVDPPWWTAYRELHPSLTSKPCAYCETSFVPSSGRQRFCSTRCAADSRRDRSYFGGRRRAARGLADGICQLCGQRKRKGLSVHHLIGKQNDPNNQELLALCRGCHHVVTLLSNMKLADDQDGWRRLIELVVVRRRGNLMASELSSTGSLSCPVGVEVSIKPQEEALGRPV